MSKVKVVLFTILTIIVYILQYILTAICVFAALAALFIRSKKFLYFVHWFWGNSLFWAMGKRLKITGKENMDNSKNYILLSNHTSIYDIPGILAFKPRVSWLGREYLLRIPFFGNLLKKTDYIPVFPGDTERSKKSINEAISKSGFITISIFPEGTRTYDGKLQDLKKGFIYILRDTELDLLPITINGLFKLKPRTRFFMDFCTKPEIIIHEPIQNQLLKKKSDDKIIKMVYDIIESELRIDTEKKR
ncbi:lysophospholipid acyltransferase family protein [Spirochaetota bacterium]